MSNKEIRYSPLLFITIVCLVQIIVYKYLSVTPYLVICLLPGMLVYLAKEWSSLKSMIIAFLIGISIDVLADGIVGLNAASLVLTALVLPAFNKQGVQPSLILLLANAVFFLPYILLDSAGVVPPLEMLLQYAVSVIVSLILDFFVARGYKA